MHLGFKVATAGGHFIYGLFGLFFSRQGGQRECHKDPSLAPILSSIPFLLGLFQHPRPKEHWQQHEEISKASKASRLLLRHPSRPRPDMCGY